MASPAGEGDGFGQGSRVGQRFPARCPLSWGSLPAGGRHRGVPPFPGGEKAARGPSPCCGSTAAPSADGHPSYDDLSGWTRHLAFPFSFFFLVGGRPVRTAPPFRAPESDSRDGSEPSPAGADLPRCGAEAALPAALKRRRVFFKHQI